MDNFSDAVGSALPMLQRMQDQIGASPVASATALDRVAASARDLRSVSRRIVASDLPQTHPPGIAPDTEWTWDTLTAATLSCTKCPHLAITRTKVVFGVGKRDAELMFVGEAPGADEDIEGEPFVGKPGQLLTKILTTMGLHRNDVYIANVLKCRPDMPPGATGNRKPRGDEIATCLPWLAEQIHLVRPRVLIALGATAIQGLLDDHHPIGAVRGKWLEYRGIPVMPTFHPAYLLQHQSIAEKRKFWEDMLTVMEHLGMPVSEKQRRFFTS